MVVGRNTQGGNELLRMCLRFKKKKQKKNFKLYKPY